MAFAGPGPSPAATPMYGAFIPAQAGYAMGAAVPYAIMPYGVPSVAAPMPGYQNVYSPDASALTQGMEHLSVSPDQRLMGGMANGAQGYIPYPGKQQQGRTGPYNGYQYPQAHNVRSQQQAKIPQGQMHAPNMAMIGHGGPYSGPPGLHSDHYSNGPVKGGKLNGSLSPLPHQHDAKIQPGQLGQPPRRRKVQRGLEDNVKRTVYISYIDQQVTEESLATFFADCGTVMDCRICGDPNSAMRFAFIEFLEIAGAQQALSKTGQTLGTGQLRVLPSKTAIVPVNKELMPRSHEELERCSRTVYVANIDKKVEREDVRNFFEHLCGKVNKIRLLGDMAHSTRIAFIEFIQAESAMAALNCSGALLGSLPLRVSPSKTPVRGDKEDRQNRGSKGNKAAAAEKAAVVSGGEDAAVAEGRQQAAEANGDNGDVGESDGTATVVEDSSKMVHGEVADTDGPATPAKGGSNDLAGAVKEARDEQEKASSGMTAVAAGEVRAAGTDAADESLQSQADGVAADVSADAPAGNVVVEQEAPAAEQ